MKPIKSQLVRLLSQSKHGYTVTYFGVPTKWVDNHWVISGDYVYGGKYGDCCTKSDDAAADAVLGQLI